MAELADFIKREKMISVLPTNIQTWVKRGTPHKATDVTNLIDTYLDSLPTSTYQPTRANYLREKAKEGTAPRKGDRPTNDTNSKAEAGRPPKWHPLKGPRCFGCQAYGHIAAECPNQAEAMVGLAVDRPQMDTYPGKIDGKEVDDILIDTGCNLSQVHADMIDSDFVQTGTVNIAGTHTSGPLPTGRVMLELEGKTFEQNVAINPNATHKAVIGVDVPEMRALVKRGTNEKWTKDDEREPTRT